VPGGRATRRHDRSFEELRRKLERTLDVPSRGSGEAAAPSMTGWDRRDDMGREQVVVLVERVDEATDGLRA
jgi:hypothetical protein